MSKTITIPKSETHWLGGDVIVDVEAFTAFAQRVQAGEVLTEIPNRWAVAKLLAFDEFGEVVVTPRGEDLLASAHLIPDDPEPKQPADDPCDACNGTGEQTLLISTHVCDVCKGAKAKPKALMHPPASTHDDAAITEIYLQTDMGVVALSSEDLKACLCPPGVLSIRVHQNLYGAANVWEACGSFICNGEIQPFTHRWIEPVSADDGWVLIDSQAAAEPFVGKRVQIDAPLPPLEPSTGAHHLHDSNAVLRSVDSRFLEFDNCGISWLGRGNVRLRLAEGSHE